MTISHTAATIPGATHHMTTVDGTTLHYVAAGMDGSPIVLIHGFPETWWAFHRVIPLLAARHRVFAVDLPGFGDSDAVGPDFTSAKAANLLAGWLADLDAGPVHLVAQDVAGGIVFRLATTHSRALRGLTAAEMGVAGFGLEALADVTHGGSWHIGVLAAPRIAELLLSGREQEFLGSWAFPALAARPNAIGEPDIAEFARTFARPGGWNGASGLYRSMLTEGPEFQATADRGTLDLPVLALGGSGGSFTANTWAAIVGDRIHTVELESAGHYPALEDSAGFAGAVLDFTAALDG